MKVTGIAIFCLGIAIGLFGLYQFMTATPVDAASPTPTASGLTFFPTAFVLTMTAAALVVGGLLWAYGGKGTIETQNPAIRN